MGSGQALRFFRLPSVSEDGRSNLMREAGLGPSLFASIKRRAALDLGDVIFAAERRA